MQSTTHRFRELTQGHVRPLSWAVSASFDKAFDAGTTFFTLDTSDLDGPDVLAPTGGGVLQEWDQYEYVDYSDRVISVEVTHEKIEPYSVVQSYADVTLNNYDSYFTPNSGSPIEEYIIPKRPFRIQMGMGTDKVPKFVGLSDKMPTLNKSERTVTFHLVDFLSFIFDKSFPADLLLQDKTTDEVLDEIFQAIGLSSSQVVLDNSSNTVPVFYAAEGDNIGNKIKDLMQAELGRLFMDEAGVIRFLNRTSVSEDSVFRFDKSNTIDYSVSTQEGIINKAIINMEILDELALKSVAESSEVMDIGIGQNRTVWLSTNNLITSANTPTYQTTPINNSHYIVHNAASGGSAYAGVTVSSFTVFANSVKIIFHNGGASIGYIQSIDIWGTPIEVVRTARISDQDDTSIDKYDEQVYEFTTQYIADDAEAQSRVSTIVNELSEYGGYIEKNVKGHMAMQVGDCVELGLDGYQGDYSVVKIVDTLAGAQYRQIVKSRLLTPGIFFTLDTSVLDGPDYLTP